MITEPCSTCHNGIDATGKHAQHLTTTAECDICHSTNAWIPATFDHALVMGSCSSCHNGVEATGAPPVHFQSSLECDACHTTTRWTSPTYAHTGFYPGDHRRALDCTECHGANNDMVTWTSPSFQPDCAACHERDFKPGPHKKVDGIDLKYTVSELRDCSGSCHEFEDAGMTRIKKTRNQEHRVGDSDF
jgi:hypothetical protein